MELAFRSIYNVLEVSAERKQIINTTISHRKIGKTKALIQFAKDNDYCVLVGSKIIAKALIKEYGYKKIRSINSACLDGLPPFVFDECCPREKIEQMKKNGHIILTGFAKKDSFYEIE